MPIYDCFTFFNELELLELRLNHLGDVVDKIVIVEATKTQSGLSKPLVLAENRERFKAWDDKIIHIIVSDMPPPIPDRWKLENFQRNAIQRGLRGCAPGDTIFISDVDELYRVEAMALAVARLHGTHPPMALGFNMNTYYYYLNCPTGGPKENWTVATTYDYFRTYDGTPQTLRDQRNDFTAIADAGWHFSWMGGRARAHVKLQAFAHRELDTRASHDQLDKSLDDLTVFFAPEGAAFTPEPVVKGKYPDYLVEHQGESPWKEMIREANNLG